MPAPDSASSSAGSEVRVGTRMVMSPARAGCQSGAGPCGARSIIHPSSSTRVTVAATSAASRARSSAALGLSSWASGPRIVTGGPTGAPGRTATSGS